MSDVNASAAQFDSKKDPDIKGQAGEVARWLIELELADKAEKDWRAQAQDVIKRIRDEGGNKRSAAKVRYNILASNIATLEPALYAQMPRPDIRPRHQDGNPLDRQVATVLEKVVGFHLDAYDFDGQAMEPAVRDMLAPGRAVTRVRYKPVMQKVTPPRVPVVASPDGENDTLMPRKVRQDTNEEVGEYQTDDETGEAYVQDEPYDKKVYEETCCEHVHWDDFRRGPGRAWSEVPWIGFRHKFTREECVEKFGAELGNKIELDYIPDGLDERKKDNDAANSDAFKRAIAWEIWNKDERKVIWILPSLKERPAKVEDDPLDLSGFFPIPMPLYARPDPSNLVPVTDFSLYKDLADELDTITRRIAVITAGLKFRGAYDSALKGLKEVMQGDDNDMLPIEGATGITANGGFEKGLFFMPIEKAAQVLRQLYEQRAQVKQDIFEISGIADIMRGQTNANETAEAQKIKTAWGTQRLQKRQRAVQRYARDLIRIMAEIIAEKYEPMTLKLMTGMDVTDDMVQVMRLDAVRSFRIDIETDSTIAADTASEQASLAELTQGLGQLVQALGPVVQTGAMPMNAAKAIIMSIVRKFKLGREVEDALDEAAKQPAPQQQMDPAAQQASNEQQKHAAEMAAVAAETQARQAKAAADMQAVQAKAEGDAAKHQADLRRLAMESQRADLEHIAAMEELEMKRAQFAAKARAAQEGVTVSAA